jgi:peptidoglycan hydrolase-like protein with peptidoglycan-binding domain
MENNLNEELLRQLLLMNFDRSKTLSEQKVIPSDRLGPQGDFQIKKLKTPENLKTEKEKYQEDKEVAIGAYNKIVKEIDGGWAPWKWGTDEQGMTDAILSIKNLQQYQILRELLGIKYPNSLYPNTLLGFIQSEEFSTMVNPAFQDMIRKGQLGLGQQYQYYTNDKFLRQMESHLRKFNPYEKPLSGFPNSLTQMIIPPSASDALHIALPVLAMVTTAFPPLSIAIELVDAGLYYAEGDNYSAGLGLCFALITFGGFNLLSKGMSTSEKVILMKKAQKEASGEVVEYSVKEKKLLESLGGVDSPKYIKYVRRAGKIKSIMNMMDEIHSITVLHKVVWWMVKKGYLPASFLTRNGITIGGTFCTWDFIASMLKICNPMGLTKLTKSENEYLQMIGGTAKFLQQFSTPCEEERGLRYFKDEVFKKEKDIKGTVLENLQVIIDGNIILTKERFESIKSVQTLSVQVSLRNLGFTKFTEIKSTYTDVKTYKPIKDELPGLSDYEIKKQQNYDPSGGIGATRLSSNLPATGNWKTDKDKNNKIIKLPEEKKVVDVTFKWGYYDYNTSMVVKEFQKKNNLTVDGEVGTNTAKKLIEKVKSLQSIKFFDSKIEKLTPEDVKKIDNYVFNYLKSELKNQSTVVDELNKKPSPTQLNQVEESFKKDLTEKVDAILWDSSVVNDIIKTPN